MAKKKNTKPMTLSEYKKQQAGGGMTLQQYKQGNNSPMSLSEYKQKQLNEKAHEDLLQRDRRRELGTMSALNTMGRFKKEQMSEPVKNSALGSQLKEIGKKAGPGVKKQKNELVKSSLNMNNSSLKKQQPKAAPENAAVVKDKETMRNDYFNRLKKEAAEYQERLQSMSPAEQYAALDKDKKSGRLRPSTNKELKQIISADNARKYVNENNLFDLEGTQKQLAEWKQKKADAEQRGIQAGKDLEDRRNAMTAEDYKAAQREVENLKNQMGVYTLLDNEGFKTSYRDSYGDWHNDETFSKRPDDYYDGNNREDYDALLYDRIHGEGSYMKRVDEMTDDAQAIRLENEMDDLWNRLQNHRLHELADIQYEKREKLDDLIGLTQGYSTEQRAAASEARYANDQIKKLEAQERYLLDYKEIMGRNPNPVEVGYIPENDRGRTDPYSMMDLIDGGIQTSDVHKIYSFANRGNEYKSWAAIQDIPKATDEYSCAMMMNDEQLGKFNDYYNKGQYKEAEQFINALQPYLRQIYQNQFGSINIQETAHILPASTSIAVQGMNALNTYLAPAQFFAGLLGDKSTEDPTSAWYKPARESNLIQQTVAEDLGEYGKLYLAGMNSVRNVINGLTTKGLGFTAKGAQMAASLTGFAMQIYQESTYKYLTQTHDYNATRGLAALDAIMETMEEMLPYEAMLSNAGRPVLRFFANAASEAAEEFTGATVGDWIKGVITGRDPMQQRADEIFNAGGYYDASGKWVNLDKDSRMALNQADMQALREKVQEVKENTLAGAIGGGFGSFYGGIANIADTYAQGQQINSERNTTAEGKTGAQRMYEMAMAMDEGTESRKMADKVKAAPKGENVKIGDWQLGHMARALAEDTGNKYNETIYNTVERDAREKLAAAGVPANQATVYSEVIARNLMTGKAMNKADIQTLARDERAIEVWKGYNIIPQELREELQQEADKANSTINSIKEMVTPAEEPGSAAAAAVQESMKAADTMEEAIDNLQAKNSGLLSEGFAKLVKEELANNPVLKKSKTYLDDIMKIQLAAKTMDSLPRTALDKDVAQRFYDAAKAEFDEVDADRVVPQAPAMEGQGKATFNGAEYGTDAWKQATEGLSKWTRNVMGAVGEVAARFGYRVNLVNDPENKDVYGFEDANTGAITINVANGFRHHMLVTMAHEMTHWLEQNSRGGYNDLRSFVLESLRKEGVNVQERIVKIMDNYNMVMKPEAGKGMTINQAMAELVAQSSEGLLSSRRAAMELQSINPTLYGRVQNYVKNIVARLDAAIHSMEYEASMSQEAKALRNYREQLADIWFTGRKDAQGQQGPIVKEEAPQAEKQTEVRKETEGQSYSIKQMEDGTKYVEVDTEQERFIGMKPKDMLKAARQIIREKFIDTNNNVFELPENEGNVKIDRSFADEYSYSSKRNLKEASKRAKGKASTEIDNLIKTGVKLQPGDPLFPNESYGHKPKNMDYYSVLFRVNGRFFTGVLNVENTYNGKRLYDVTQIKIDTSRSGLNRPAVGTTDIAASAEPNITQENKNSKSFSVAQRDDEEDNKKGSLTAAADLLNPALTSETTIGSSASEESITEYEKYVNRKKAKADSEEARLDQEYLQAILDKDEKKQLRMLREKLNNTKGIYPFYSASPYMGRAIQISKRIKNGDMAAISIAAYDMAKYVPDNAVLIPMPGHEGVVTDNTDTMLLAKELGRITGKPVINALEGISRESRYEAKLQNKKGITAEEMGFRQIMELPEGTIPMIIDNVVSVGETAKAAITAIPGGSVLSYTKGKSENVVQGLKAAFATKDKEGKDYVPLSKKFDINNPNWRYSIAQMDKDYQAAVDSGNVEEQQNIIKEAAEEAGFDTEETAYHGTDNFGFTEFKMDISQDEIFVAYNKETAGTYTRNAKVKNISDKVDFDKMSGEELAKFYKDTHRTVKGTTYIDGKNIKEEINRRREEYLNQFKGMEWPEDFKEVFNEEINKMFFNHYQINDNFKTPYEYVEGLIEEMERAIDTGERIDNDLSDAFDQFTWLITETNDQKLEKARELYKLIEAGADKIEKWGGVTLINDIYSSVAAWSPTSVKDALRIGEDKGGIYQFYTKPGKQLIVNAHGANWNGIPFIADMRRISTKNEYMGPMPTESYEWEEFKRAGWLMTTRGISKWARENGFDSVRINNVYDHGGRGHGTGYGDIGIFFNQEDVKSADPVTYDDNGNVIKPSERFTESNDLRYSIAQSPDMEVNNFMMGLNEFNLPTYQEKTMLRQYKDARTRAELLRYGIRERENERKKLLAMEKRGLKENKRLSQINDFLARDRARLNQLEKTLVDVTRDKGYARLMMNQKNLMDNLVSGRTAGELEETVNNIQKNLDDVTKEMTERAENLKKLASAEAVLKIRQMFDARGLKDIAAKLKNDLGSELENKEIENRLAMIALKMKEGKYDAETAEELADLLAGRMQGEYEGYFISELRGSTITLGPAQLKELKGSGRSLSDIRQQLAGTGIRIGTKGSTTLDAKWDELCDIFPTLDRNESAGNMLDVLLDKITSEKNEQPTVYNNEQLMDTNRMILEAAQKLIPEIITDENSLKLIRETMAFVARVSGAAKNNAEAMDDINAMISQLQKKSSKAIVTARKLTGDIGETIEYFDQLSLQSEAAMWKQERLNLIDQLKSENTKALMEEADKWREKIEKDKAFRELAGENLHTRRKITTNVSRLRKLLINETDLKNIPEHMKGLAREMLGIIVENDLARRKLTGIDRKDLAETGRVLEEMKKLDGDFTPDDLRLIADEEAQAVVMDALADLEEGLEEYNSHRTGTMMDNANAVKATLDKISDAVSKITGIINAERSVAFLDRQVTVGEAADDVRKDFQNSRFKGELAGRGSKAVNTVKRAVVYGNMTPEYYIENLRNKGMTELWQDAKRGENRNGLEVRRAKDRIGQLAEETGYKAWADEKKEVTLGGRKRTLKIGSIMELYAIWKREHTSNPEMSQHLAKGGVFFQEDNEQDKVGVIRHVRTEQRAVRVTDEEIQAMYDSLTAQQKQLIDGVVKYLSSDMSDLGNDASMRMYGIKKYKETYYFPMKVWDGVKAARSDKGITGTTENRSAHYSWSKRRQHMASNALVIGDFMTDAVNHIVEMINYNTMAPAIENINKVLNYKFTEDVGTDDETKRTLRAMFQENYGTESLKYMEQLLQDMNGGPAQDQRKTLRDRALSIFKKNAVAGSMSVALQQPLSYIRAAMMINPKYLTEGLAKFWKGSYQEMIQHSGVAVIKDMGKFDMNFGQSAKDYIMPETKKSLYKKTTDVLTVAPQLMDTMTWTRMWSAVKAEQAAKNPGMDTKSAAFMDKVTERFNDLVRKTQVYDSVLVKSSNMRSQNLGMKVITSFMAEPTLSLNVLADAIRNTDLQGGKAKLAKAGATFLVSAVMQAVVKGLMGSGRTPDRKKTWLENFLNKLQYNLMNEANPVSLIPGYSDIIEVLKTGELKDDAMGAIGKLFSIGDTIKKAAQGNGKGWYRDIEDTAAQFAQLFTNIPAKNLMRDMRAVYNWISGTEYASRPTSGNVLKYQAEANLYSGDNLLGALNAWLGEAGFKTTASSYYGRMYNAMKNGDQGTAEGLKEYMSLGRGTSDEAIKTGLKNAAKKDKTLTEAQKDAWMIDNDLMGESSAGTITTQYKEGKISAAEARKLWKKLDPKLTDNDLYWKQDRIDYQKQTGADSVSGYSYRLKDAIANNKGEEIRKAVKAMLDHGRTQAQVKDALSDWKSPYLAGDQKTRAAIRDALQKAYKAAGLTVQDADKTIDGWKKNKNSSKGDNKDTTGRYGKGNIDLNNRKVVHNSDGSISTEKSFSTNIDGKEVLLPTIINGKEVSEEEAIQHYLRTGENLGIFNTVKEARDYAQKLHKRQDWYYNK